jgi:hypothetical protein
MYTTVSTLQTVTASVVSLQSMFFSSRSIGIRFENKPDPTLFFISFQLNIKRTAKSRETIPLKIVIKGEHLDTVQI